MIEPYRTGKPVTRARRIKPAAPQFCSCGKRLYRMGHPPFWSYLAHEDGTQPCKKKEERQAGVVRAQEGTALNLPAPAPQPYRAKPCGNLANGSCPNGCRSHEFHITHEVYPKGDVERERAAEQAKRGEWARKIELIINQMDRISDGVQADDLEALASEIRGDKK